MSILKIVNIVINIIAMIIWARNYFLIEYLEEKEFNRALKLSIILIEILLVFVMISVII